MQKTIEALETVAIRFAGDSGDGMQLTGDQFTTTTAMVGNDLATFPDFPAEIRAPAGSLAGVSGFQINFSSTEVFTPGDRPDVLVAMNPAALRTNLADLKPGGILILNTEQFNAKNLERAGYKSDPQTDGTLAKYKVYPVDITNMTLRAISEVGLNQRAAVRSKNFFALGLVYWLFNRPMDHTLTWIRKRFGGGTTELADANERALKAGYHYGETAEIFTHSFTIEQAAIQPGRYRRISGNEALGLGLLAAAELSGLELLLGSYPITPASDVLHFLSKQKHLGVKTFQAEDEIAAVCAALGAAYAGGLGVTTTSGPGMALKSEAINLALMLELPLLIFDVQRAGPSTGMPTKTEQADLLQVMFGRNGEAPLVVIAAKSPGDCFYTAIEAARIAVRHMLPVIVLTDGYLANGAEPWPIPDMAQIPRIPVQYRTDPEGFLPYLRDEVLSRPWAIPGTPGLEHRIGGLEKQHLTGNVSYDPENHERMVKLRAEKVQRVADLLPPTEIEGDPEGDLLVIGWGCSDGAIKAAVAGMRQRGHRIGHIQLRHLSPFPKDLGEIMNRYSQVLVPELNLGQLAFLLRGRYVREIHSYTKVQGRPFMETEIRDAIAARLEAH
jgi:2-oxoglutarate ferredoxin oxidoreductase subunit alpha